MPVGPAEIELPGREQAAVVKFSEKYEENEND